MTRYCTLAFAKAEMDTRGTSKTLDDAQIMTYIAAVSRRVDAMLQPNKKLAQRPFFAPYIESRPIQIRPFRVNSPNGTLDMGMYLLELTTILAGTEDVTTKVAGYVAGFPPFDMLQIATDCYETWYTLECSPVIRRHYPNPLTITGKWGWHADWANAFAATGTLLAGYNATVTTMVLSVGQGDLFSAGNMILIDDEYLEVSAVTADTLTVVRGVNGSTAAAHLILAPVSILQIPDDIQRVVARQTDQLYARRGSFSVQTLTQLGLVQYPQDLVLELENTIANYRME